MLPRQSIEARDIIRRATGRKLSTYESYRNTMAGLVAYLGHDDAARLTPENIIGFKDHRLSSINPRTKKPISAKTVKDSDLAGLKTVFAWAVSNRRVASNPAAGITIKLGKPTKLRSKGFAFCAGCAWRRLGRNTTSITPRSVTATRGLGVVSSRPPQGLRAALSEACGSDTAGYTIEKQRQLAELGYEDGRFEAIGSVQIDGIEHLSNVLLGLTPVKPRELRFFDKRFGIRLPYKGTIFDDI